MKIQIKIRIVEPSDIPQLVALCRAHAAYEKNAYKENGQESRLLSDLFSEPPKVYGLVVEQEGRLLGYATYMRQYATWEAAEYLYLDCLYLKDVARGLGIGRRLMKQIRKEAQRMGCQQLQWQTPDFNNRAIKFYDSLGARSKSKERFSWDGYNEGS